MLLHAVELKVEDCGVAAEANAMRPKRRVIDGSCMLVAFGMEFAESELLKLAVI